MSAAAGSHDRIKAELMQSVAETATRVVRTVAEAVEDAVDLRRRLRDAARERGSLIAGGGTHPFSRYEHQEITESPRYLALADSMQWVAQRELIFGLHIHVGLESARQAIAVSNALRTWLPELLAISANSPFWQGRDTGLASTRTQVFETFPRTGLPPAFSSFEEFEQLIERGVKTNSLPDYTFIWWDLRPHPKLGTIEIRICDAQTRVESLAGIAALVQSLVGTLAERYGRGQPMPVQPRTLIEENKWRAARYGLDGQLIDLERDEERPARQAVAMLLELATPAARRLACSGELQAVERILDLGTGAREQRRVQAETQSLLAVARWLAEQTVCGL